MAAALESKVSALFIVILCKLWHRYIKASCRQLIQASTLQIDLISYMLCQKSEASPGGHTKEGTPTLKYKLFPLFSPSELHKDC